MSLAVAFDSSASEFEVALQRLKSALKCTFTITIQNEKRLLMKITNLVVWMVGVTIRMVYINR